MSDSRWRTFKTWVLRGVILVSLLAGTALAVGYWALRSSLPNLEGRHAVAGLDSSIEIVRGAFGVPHIFAGTATDAYFGLGFAHAQDRLWQMEVQRRVGAGRLSEVLGTATLDLDKFFRTLGLVRAAAQSLAAVDDATRAVLGAYAAGVNAFLATRKGLLPPEFLILRAPAPEPWSAVDSIVVLKLMTWQLSMNWRDELLRARLADRLAPDRIDELWPPYPADAPATLLDLSTTMLDALWTRTPSGAGPGTGSNNWAVAGARSASGKPLLANDPHLGLSAPGPLYLAHLSAPGFDLVGATLPGLPNIVLGHNGRIAWSLTTTGADTQDLFVERPDPADPARYLTPDGPMPFEARREVIAVRGAADVEITVRESRHGPIVSDVIDDAGNGEPLALRWTALDADDTSPQGLLKLDAAQDWDAFLDATRDIHAPQQNVVYADVDGNIGFYAPARVPIRKAGDGSVPVPGWTGDHDWIGYIPFDELPHSLNPSRGVIVTANNRIVPDGYPYLIARDWAPPYRARRIEELIAGQPRHTPESFRVIQADVVSLMARDMLPHLASAEPGTAAGREIQGLLAGWDGTMAADRPEPLIFWAWYRELTRLVYADELGDLFGGAWGPRPLFMRWVLGGGGARWCDDIGTDTVESCAARAATALDSAAADLAAQYGDDPAAWRWGDAHAADHGHPVFRNRALLGALFGYRQGNGGDHYTINAAGFTLGNESAPFTQVHGPAFRAIYDLADLERSLFVPSTGQSGHPLSPHYRDTAERWLAHRPFAIPTSREAIEGPRIVLTPR